MKKKYQIGIALLILVITSCNKDNETKTLSGCDSNNTIFNQLYNSVLNTTPNIERVTLDTKIHGYTFEVTSPATICKIGYRSQPTFETMPYLIEIYNETTNTIVYSGNHTFLSSNTEYVSINPVVLTVGNSYTIRRIQNNYTGDITIYIGRVIYKPNLSSNLGFPFTLGILKITNSTFDSTSAGISDIYLPYIDIVFE